MERVQLHCNLSFICYLNDSTHLIVKNPSETLEFFGNYKYKAYYMIFAMGQFSRITSLSDNEFLTKSDNLVGSNLFRSLKRVPLEIKTTFIKCSSEEFKFGQKCICNRNVPT